MYAGLPKPILTWGRTDPPHREGTYGGGGKAPRGGVRALLATKLIEHYYRITNKLVNTKGVTLIPKTSIYMTFLLRIQCA